MGASLPSHRALAVVVPVKAFAGAKRRLASLLSEHERAELARFMLLDVLRAARSACPGAWLIVVTADAAVAAVAQSNVAAVLHEPSPAGMSPAVARAAATVVESGYDRMLVLPSDIPLITEAEIQRITSACGARSTVILVPARDYGTNALCCAPDAMGFCFGVDSFHAHCRVAIAGGLTPVVLQLERVNLDIDTSTDVAQLLEHGSSTCADAYLRAIGVPMRLTDHASSAPRAAVASVPGQAI